MAEPDTIRLLLQDAHGRILGFLVRRCGNFDDAEDICQDVMIKALQHWQESGVPPNPMAWLYTTARNSAIDRFRSYEHSHRESLPEHEEPAIEASVDKVLDDDLLRLIFTCCHPALADNVRVPMTLKSITGLSLEEVASAFLTPVKTMEQRLLRARKKIAQAGIPFEIPEGKQLEPRLQSVMQTLYLLFNEGYFASTGEALMQPRLCREAIALTTEVQRLFPGRAELIALLAMMLLHDARREARASYNGELVLLTDQDRKLWDQQQIQQALALLDKALHLRQPPGEYQLQASIAALHAEAANAIDTDWPQITLLYQKLLALSYSPVRHLNYVVALIETGNLESTQAGLDKLREVLNDYFPFHCAQADLARRQGRLDQAISAYEVAMGLTANLAEQQFVARQIRQLSN